MRGQVGVFALHAEAPHYGTGKGATMYHFVSDQFSTLAYEIRIILVRPLI